MSIDEARKEAVSRAKLQALADNFGTRIIKATNTQMKNDGFDSKIDFFSTGTSEIAGEWIETIGDPSVEITYIDDTLVVKAKVKGKARPIIKKEIPLIARVLRNNTNDTAESDVFMNGDKIFLSFQAPVNGNILVYLIDHVTKQAYCLLPYASSETSSISIIRDKRYVFFSEKESSHQAEQDVDEYSLTCSGHENDYNDVIILFSTNNLIKENSHQIASNIPRQMPVKNFNEWLTQLKISDNNLQTIIKPIIIKPESL